MNGSKIFSAKFQSELRNCRNEDNTHIGQCLPEDKGKSYPPQVALQQFTDDTPVWT